MERSSTQRSDVGRAIFFERLLKAWEKRGDLSFGELLVGGVSMLSPAERLERLEVVERFDVIERFARLSDTEIAEAVERFVLLGEGPPPTERPAA